MSTPLVASEIKTAATRYFVKKRMAVNEEMGLCRGGRFRADLLCLSFSGDVTIVEVKSSVADFRADKKWHNYVELSNRFYFAMSPAVYAKVKDDIPRGVGVLLVSRATDRMGRNLLKSKVAKYAFRRELDAVVNLDLIIRLAFRNAQFNRFAKHRKAK
jgi:hypothetical protein